jgi:hypothetical protein
VIGHVDPTLPQPTAAAAAKHGCGGLGTIIMIVVAVAVTVATSGAAATYFGVAESSGLSTMGLGTAVLTGGAGLSGATLAAAAIGGAAGSAASQAVGLAMGNVDRFSWKAVGLSALGASAGVGVGAGINSLAEGSSVLSWAAKAVNGNAYARAAVAAGAASAVTQAMQGRWSWREVGAAAAGAAAGAAVGRGVGYALTSVGMAAVSPFVSRFAGGLAAGWASEQVKAIDPNYTAARLSTMYAGALGGAFGGDLSEGETLQGVGPGSAANYRNGSDIDSDTSVVARLRSENYSLANRTSTKLAGNEPAPRGFFAAESRDYRFTDPTEISMGSPRQESGGQYVVPPYAAPLGRPLSLPDIGKVLLPGSYGGDYVSVTYEGQEVWSDARSRLVEPKVNMAFHSGGLGMADQVLSDLQTYADAQVQRTQDQGAEAYAQGRTFAAVDAALAYFPQRVIADGFKGLVGVPRLYTSDTMLPGLINAVSHPLNTAGAIGRAIANNPASENIILGTEFLGPAALKIGSPTLVRLNDLPLVGHDLGGASSSIGRLSYVSSSGIELLAKPGSTTTILGSYSNDMRSVVNELGNVKSVNFGPRVGGLNVLNVPDNLYAPKTFWAEYNRPWLSNAIERGDTFLMSTPPRFDVLDVKGGISVLMRLDATTGKTQLSGFGREYLMMRQSGYIYQNGLMVQE